MKACAPAGRVPVQSSSSSSSSHSFLSVSRQSAWISAVIVCVFECFKTIFTQRKSGNAENQTRTLIKICTIKVIKRCFKHYGEPLLPPCGCTQTWHLVSRVSLRPAVTVSREELNIMRVPRSLCRTDVPLKQCVSILRWSSCLFSTRIMCLRSTWF